MHLVWKFDLLMIISHLVVFLMLKALVIWIWTLSDPGVKCDYRVSESSVSNSNTCKSFATNCKFFSSKASFSPPPVLRVWCQRVSAGEEGQRERKRERRPSLSGTTASPRVKPRFCANTRPYSDTWRLWQVPICWKLCSKPEKAHETKRKEAMNWTDAIFYFYFRKIAFNLDYNGRDYYTRFLTTPKHEC